MLVPRARIAEAAAIAKEAAAGHRRRRPAQREDAPSARSSATTQFEKIQRLIETGIDEGAELVTGGPGRPDGLDRGYFVKPTVFANVRNDMTIAREEIFGPVLCILPYDTEDEAIRIANDTPYGLSGYVSSGDPERALRVARAAAHRQRAPQRRHASTSAAPFGGYKQSGNGREWGEYGFEEFLEVKAVMGVGK